MWITKSIGFDLRWWWWNNKYWKYQTYSFTKSMHIRNNAIETGSSFGNTSGREEGRNNTGISGAERNYGFTATMGHASRWEILDRTRCFSTEKIHGRQRKFDQQQSVHAFSSRLVTCILIFCSQKLFRIVITQYWLYYDTMIRQKSLYWQHTLLLDFIFVWCKSTPQF